MEVIAAVEFEVENVLEEEVCSAYGFSVHFRFYLFFFSLHSSLLRAMKRFVSDVSLLPRRMIYNAVYLAPRPVIVNQCFPTFHSIQTTSVLSLSEGLGRSTETHSPA